MFVLCFIMNIYSYMQVFNFSDEYIIKSNKLNILFTIMALPHLKNSTAGRNKFDPVHSSIFECRFTLPEAIRADFGKDEFLLTEHVLKIDGLNALNRAPGTGTQKFMGTDRSYINPKLDSTRAEISIDFTLNLRDDVDNYIYKILRAWAALGYDINTGARSLKREYCADWLNVAIANRRGDIFHEIIFKDVMINGDMSGYLDSLDYETSEAAQITLPLVSDWWMETKA